MFAKLFDTIHGQTLAKLDEGEDGPEIRCYWQPPELGVCSAAIKFPASDLGWDKAEALFALLTAEAAAEFITNVSEQGEPVMAAMAQLG